MTGIVIALLLLGQPTPNPCQVADNATEVANPVAYLIDAMTTDGTNEDILETSPEITSIRLSYFNEAGSNFFVANRERNELTKVGIACYRLSYRTIPDIKRDGARYFVTAQFQTNIGITSLPTVKSLPFLFTPPPIRPPKSIRLTAEFELLE